MATLEGATPSIPPKTDRFFPPILATKSLSPIFFWGPRNSGSKPWWNHTANVVHTHRSNFNARPRCGPKIREFPGNLRQQHLSFSIRNTSVKMSDSPLLWFPMLDSWKVEQTRIFLVEDMISGNSYPCHSHKMRRWMITNVFQWSD